MFMQKEIICCPAINDALRYCAGYLQAMGLTITVSPAPDTTCLILPVPSFTIHKAAAEELISRTAPHVRICGGNLQTPLLADRRTVDFLQDPYYLADNASITADCALQFLESRLEKDLRSCRILILGWGRIGKCLTHQLTHLNAPITVYARKPEDRAMLRSLGYHPITAEELPRALQKFRCVVNTAPASILSKENGKMLRPDCFKLDLASIRSIPGDGVLHARGLPGKYKPESSGKLIARTILYHVGGDRK